MMHWLIPYILLTCGLMGSLALFVSVKREIGLGAARNRKRIDQIVERLEQAHSREAEFVPPPLAKSGLNVSRRVQAMRMVRRNTDVSHIAAALGITRREVELLIRVQKMPVRFQS